VRPVEEVWNSESNGAALNLPGMWPAIMAMPKGFVPDDGVVAGFLSPARAFTRQTDCVWDLRVSI
jgi:hypothetical protein